jgi:uncharacterized repeat protein (TIGR03803 family)
MRRNKLFAALCMSSVTLIALVLVAAAGAGNVLKDTILHSFGNGTDGAYPFGALLQDSKGNYYGTTYEGGSGPCGDGNGCGMVFELSPTSKGTYTENVLYNFQGSPNDGGKPRTALVMDSSGNLYGTTQHGGNTNCVEDCGTVYELSPGSSGWTESIIYKFTGGKDGEQPYAELLPDTSGNFYSTTNAGGAHGKGTVFELSPSNGSWKLTTLRAFRGTDGEGPLAGVIFDASGNLYGTTAMGGKGHGTVFELSPSSGGWTLNVLYEFAGGPTDGSQPRSDLGFDSSGNLYGTTQYGGAGTVCKRGCGTVFELSPSGSGTWTESVIYSFGGAPDGAYPFSAPTFDKAGDIFGTTDSGGSSPDCGDGCGVIYELTPSNGTWTESVIYDFKGFPKDGARSYATMIFDGKGHLFGSTIFGGPYHAGVVFKITPP